MNDQEVDEAMTTKRTTAGTGRRLRHGVSQDFDTPTHDTMRRREIVCWNFASQGSFSRRWPAFLT